MLMISFANPFWAKNERGLCEFRAKVRKFLSIDDVNSLKANPHAFRSSGEKTGVRIKNLTGTNRCENKCEKCFNCLLGQIEFTAFNFSYFNRLRSVKVFVKSKNLTLNPLDEKKGSKQASDSQLWA